MKSSLEIIFEDENIIVVNKPGGLLSIPDRFDPSKKNVFDLLFQSINPLFVVHRIDKDTSGTIVFAKTASSHQILNDAFQNRQVEKSYLAICHGKPDPIKGFIDARIAHSAANDGRMTIHPKGKEALSFYNCLKTWKQFSLIECQPETGRTHQIRIHLKHISCPIVADPMYGRESALYIQDIKSKARFGKNEDEKIPLIARTALHAQRLKFRMFDQELEFECPIPKDMRAVIHQMDKWQN